MEILNLWIYMEIIVCLLSPVIVFAENKREHCDNESYEAHCPNNQVVLMTMAKAGRLFRGRCVDTDRGHQGCHGDVLLHMDAKCSGRQSCEVPVVEVSKKQSNCPNDLSSFLIAEYRCIPVITCNKEECERSDFLRPSSVSSYLAGSVATETGCGTNQCPWMIEVAQGQQIQFVLHDFTVAAESEGAQCIRFAMIFDGNTRKELNNCGGQQNRERIVYTSITNTVKIELYPMSSEKYNYMIKYTAHGCADIVTPKNAKSDRAGDALTVTCQYSKSAWHLTCNGNQWVGDVGTCPDSQVNLSGSTDEETANSSLGMLFVIGLGIALGILVGFALLCIVAAYMKRKHKDDVQKASPLLHGNPQYRDYLSKTGTMFGLYPTGQMVQEVGDNTLIYRPVHDYTSTLHPHQNRSLPVVHELVTHHHNSAMINVPFGDSPNYRGVINPHEYPNRMDDDCCGDSSLYNQSTISAHGDTTTDTSVTGGALHVVGSGITPRDHIYELPSFPDRNRAHSADSGLAYSVNLCKDQTNHRTT